MRQFMKSRAADIAANAPGGTFWTVVMIIGLVLRVILELTDMKNSWNGEEE